VRKTKAQSFLTVILAGFVFCTAHLAQAASHDLQVYFIDVDGGQSTLFITPAGKSLLIDTGWAGNNGLDAGRIVAAAKDAGVSKIDYLLLTHYHADHIGGLTELLAHIPVGTFIDHGPDSPTDPSTKKAYPAYQALLANGHYGHITPKPGDVLPIPGIKAVVISSNGELLNRALPGAGQPNAYCKSSETRPEDQTDNARSLGTLFTFGKTRILDLGDLTWDKEMQLMCPTNKVGKVDILVVSHHGLFQSSSPALVNAIAPRVAIMNNGAKKGGSPPTFETLAKAPGLETLWQLHFSDEAGSHNTAAQYIANPSGTDVANYLKVTVSPNGSFKVFNSRTGETNTYTAR
jgi:beta-lactamase superfamily II metal-dependent hydrolase